MVLLQSEAMDAGIVFPDFTLRSPFGDHVTLSQAMGMRGIVVVFTCNHCPYAIKIWPDIIQLSKEFDSSGISTIAINPNIHPDYPDDSPDKMIVNINQLGIPFPYLIDDTQSIATAYGAVCTPDIYMLTPNRQLFYRGRIDDLKCAIDSLVNDRELSFQPTPSIGCSIKWL